MAHDPNKQGFSDGDSSEEDFDDSLGVEDPSYDESSDASVDDALRPSFARRSINMDDVNTKKYKESFAVVQSERLLEVDLNNLTQGEYNVFEEALFAWRKGARASTFFTILKSGSDRLKHIATNLFSIFSTQKEALTEKQISNDIVNLLRATNPRGRNALKQISEDYPESLDISRKTFHCSCGKTNITVRPLIDRESGNVTPGVFEVTVKAPKNSWHTLELRENSNDGEGIVVGRHLVSKALFGAKNESEENVLDLMPDICITTDGEFSKAGMRLRVEGGRLFIYNSASLNPFKDFSHPDLPSQGVTEQSKETAKKVEQTMRDAPSARGGGDTLLSKDDDKHDEEWRKQNELDTWHDGDGLPKK